MEKLLYGAAYYYEYLPYERLEQDIQMMKKAGINTVRIAESTWSTYEPQEGVFDFSSVTRVLDAMEAASISVIIGTPSYAVPAWMIKSYPEILADTINGRRFYGPRQIMDITHPAYRFYAGRIIRELMKQTAHRACVIGFQLDNETKYYGTAGKNVQEKFVKYLRQKFQDNLNAMNRAFGLDYWSNRIDAWEDFPDVRGTINGSLGAEFEKFQRSLVEEFLAWQAAIVNEYKRKDQFLTHNFDFAWRGYSYGIQPEVHQYRTAKCLTIAGADIYHPSQDALSGIEIAFGGDLARSLKGGNYLILETQAQGYPGWTPYKGQLRLQAFSHIASGAASVMYWHWHSLHNAAETYWKGLLSHDFAENETYLEACTIGEDFKRLGSHLAGLKKENSTAILISNDSLTALKWFGIGASASGNGQIEYNDIVRWIYDALFHMNIECDFIWPESENLDDYKVILVPALYAAPDALLEKLCRYVENGGHLAVTFKSAFTDEHVKVRHEIQPYILRRCLGVRYHQFAFPDHAGLSGSITQGAGDCPVRTFMELLIPEGAETLASYEHYSWNGYAAVTRNTYGKGSAYYIGCMMDEPVLASLLRLLLNDAGIQPEPENLCGITIRSGINKAGHGVHFYLNYSARECSVPYSYPDSTDLFTGETIATGALISAAPWGFRILEENGI